MPGTADRDAVEKNNDLRAFLRSDRPSIERTEFNETYRRTRIAVNVLIAVSVLVIRDHFDHRPYVVTGIVIGCSLILLHAYLRRARPLLESVSFDTFIYMGLSLLADLPEVAIFVAMTQAYVVFFFVRVRTALITAGIFTLLGIVAAAISIFSDFQRRSAAETVAIVTFVTLTTIVPAAWTLLRAGFELHSHRAEEERLVAEKDQLLVDKDRFVASVSHELRTPLTAVVGLAHTLADGRDSFSAEEQDEFMGMIVQQSEEVAAIVDDLLVAARAGTGHLSLVVGELDLGAELKAIAPKPFTIHQEQESPVLVIGDPIRVRQVLRNLTSNSIRYGGPSKRVRIFRRGYSGVVSVEDDGEPIPEDQAEAIFTAYGRAHNRPGRTDSVGLGLTVSRQLAQMMGGDVVYSHDGQWASFEFWIPMAMNEMAEAMFAAPETALLAHQMAPS